MTYTCANCGKTCQANGVPSWWIWANGTIYCSMRCKKQATKGWQAWRGDVP